MDEKLDLIKATLQDDESILWFGEPEEFETMDKTHGPVIKKSAIIAIIVGILLSVAYFLFAKSSEAEIKIAYPVVFMAVAIYAGFSKVFDSGKLRKMIAYSITNKRVIVLNNNKTRAIEYEYVKSAEFRTDADGHTSLLLGDSGLKLKDSQIRNRTITGLRTGEGGICECMALYGIKDADKVKSVLKEYLKF